VFPSASTRSRNKEQHGPGEVPFSQHRTPLLQRTHSTTCVVIIITCLSSESTRSLASSSSFLFLVESTLRISERRIGRAPHFNREDTYGFLHIDGPPIHRKAPILLRYNRQHAYPVRSYRVDPGPRRCHTLRCLSESRRSIHLEMRRLSSLRLPAVQGSWGALVAVVPTQTLLLWLATLGTAERAGGNSLRSAVSMFCFHLVD
jgi:hypothetical protein